MTWIDIAVLILYFGGMIGIGIWVMRRIKNQEDYFIGGRGFGKLLQTFAAFGAGDFRIDFLLYKWLGYDLANASKATIETLRRPTRLVLPFLVQIIASFFTPRNSREALDRYYVKMKTEVDPDQEADLQNLELSYQNPNRFEDRLLFPGTDLEFVKPRPKDYIGFLASIGICFLVIAVLIWLAGIGG